VHYSYDWSATAGNSSGGSFPKPENSQPDRREKVPPPRPELYTAAKGWEIAPAFRAAPPHESSQFGIGVEHVTRGALGSASIVPPARLPAPEINSLRPAIGVPSDKLLPPGSMNQGDRMLGIARFVGSTLAVGHGWTVIAGGGTAFVLFGGAMSVAGGVTFGIIGVVEALGGFDRSSQKQMSQLQAITGSGWGFVAGTSVLLVSPTFSRNLWPRATLNERRQHVLDLAAGTADLADLLDTGTDIRKILHDRRSGAPHHAQPLDQEERFQVADAAVKAATALYPRDVPDPSEPTSTLPAATSLAPILPVNPPTAERQGP
jgi:hypothetical protein